METTQNMKPTTSVIARRRTAQDSIVCLWSDGSLTWALGRYIKGSPCARTAAQVSVALAAGWLVLGDIDLYNDDELEGLVRAARWTAARGGDPGDMRERLHGIKPLRPAWVTLETDRDGKPVEQCWRLPRVFWAGLAVFRRAGRYSIWSEIQRTGSFSPTGMEFNNLVDLSAYLLEVRA